MPLGSSAHRRVAEALSSPHPQLSEQGCPCGGLWARCVKLAPGTVQYDDARRHSNTERRAVVERMGEFLGAAHQHTVKWQRVLEGMWRS